MPDNYTKKPESLSDNNLSDAAGGITSPKKFFKKTWDKLRGKEKLPCGDYVECTCQCPRCFRKFTMRSIGGLNCIPPLCEDCRAGKNPPTMSVTK